MAKSDPENPVTPTDVPVVIGPGRREPSDEDAAAAAEAALFLRDAAEAAAEVEPELATGAANTGDAATTGETKICGIEIGILETSWMGARTEVGAVPLAAAAEAAACGDRFFLEAALAEAAAASCCTGAAATMGDEMITGLEIVIGVRIGVTSGKTGDTGAAKAEAAALADRFFLPAAAAAAVDETGALSTAVVRMGAIIMGETTGTVITLGDSMLEPTEELVVAPATACLLRRPAIAKAPGPIALPAMAMA